MREQGLFVSISSGVKAERPCRRSTGWPPTASGADYITIDIAHGHADSVRRTIEHIKQQAAQAFVIAGNVGHARGGDRSRELGRRRHQGRRRPGQGLHHAAEDRLRHRRLAAVGAQVVRARGHQADRRRRRHPPPRRHRQERALRRRDGDDRLAVRRPRGEPGRRRSRSTASCYKEYYGSASRLQQGRVQARRRQAHPRADQGQAGRHAARDARGPAKLDQLRRRPRARPTCAR